MRMSGSKWVAVVVVSVGALAGCSSSEAPDAAAAGAGAAPTSGAPAAAGGEAAGAEAPTVSFTHPTLKYTVSAPGPMVVGANGDAAYTGPSDFLTIALVTGSGDPMAQARADASGTGVAGFALTQPAKAVTISGLAGASLEFTRDAATNAVTGKAQTAHVVRTYLPGPAGSYRLEYGATVSAQNWDAQGAMDLLATFRPGP